MGRIVATAVALAALMCCFSWCTATVHTVGDSGGWTAGTDYSSWTNGKTFAVGDSLVFNYMSGAHSVVEVSKDDYSTCTSTNTISSDSSGASTISLNSPGTRYFICGASGHCSSGMKLAVPVQASTGATSPSTTPDAGTSPDAGSTPEAGTTPDPGTTVPTFGTPSVTNPGIGGDPTTTPGFGTPTSSDDPANTVPGTIPTAAGVGSRATNPDGFVSSSADVSPMVRVVMAGMVLVKVALF